MPKVELERFQDLKDKIGQEVYVSDWVEVTQERINKFAEATGDFNWIHVDVERARKESPYKAAIAHGNLTLTMCALLAQNSISYKNKRAGVNYGSNKVRYIEAVRAGDKIRSRGVVLDYAPIERGAQITWKVTVDIEGRDKPACVAETIARLTE